MDDLCCRICRSEQVRLAEQVQSGQQTLDLYLCADCGSYSYIPAPEIDYRHHTDNPLAVRRYLETTAAIEWMIVNVMTVIGQRTGGRLLDIGCGFGFSADAAKRLAGWTAIGVEPSTWGRLGAEALGLEIIGDFIDRSHVIASQRFDVVHASEVIEHVPDPVDFLTFLGELLSLDGVLVVTTPNGSALAGPLSQPMRNAVLSPGAHVALFTKQALADGLSRAGFKHVMVDIRGQTLVGYASNSPLNLFAADPVTLGAAYVHKLIEAAPADDALLAGLRFRLFKYLVDGGDYESATEVLRDIEADLSPLRVTSLSADDYAAEHRSYAGVLCYYAGILALNHQQAPQRARELFSWSHTHCRHLVAMAPHDAVFEQIIVWHSLFHEALAHEAEGNRQAAAPIYAGIVVAAKSQAGDVPDDIRQRAATRLAAIDGGESQRVAAPASSLPPTPRAMSNSAETPVVYTAIFDDYDDAPTVDLPEAGLRYVLFTDGHIEAPAPWEVRRIGRVFRDPQRDARRVKLLPHIFLPEHDLSVWIDANCRLRQLTAKDVAQLLGDAEIAVSRHHDRDCLFDEADVLLTSGDFDSAAAITRQVARYDSVGMPRHFGLHATMMLIRRHNEPNAKAFANSWWAEVASYSKRDQLSFDFVRWTSQSRVRSLDLDYTGNDHYVWGKAGAGGHRSGNRLTNEHLSAAVFVDDIPHRLVARYRPRYDVWARSFLQRLYELNAIIAAAGAPLVDNLCYFHLCECYRDAPPDPRRGRRRELYLRSIAASKHLVEIGFDGGYAALLALEHHPLKVSAIDNSSHAYTAAARYLTENFPDRFRFYKMDSRSLMCDCDVVGLAGADVVHIAGRRRLELSASDLLTVATMCQAGTTILVDDIYADTIAAPVAVLVSQGVLAKKDDLACSESAAFVLARPVPRYPAADHDNRVAALVGCAISEDFSNPSLGVDTTEGPNGGLEKYAKLTAEIERLREQLSEIKSSTSWRGTEPLRKIVTVVRDQMRRHRG